MADEWSWTSIGDVCVNFDSQRVPVKKADRKPGPYPYYGASGIVDYVDDFLFDGEYLLVAEDGANLLSRNTPIAFMARGRFWVNNHAHIIQGNERADTQYLMYALEESSIGAYVTGSAQPKLSQQNLNAIPLLLPPYKEQERIVRVLGQLDHKIELNRQVNLTLEATASAVFRSWFIDYEPVVAKVDGRPPLGMSADVAALFPEHFSESEMGPVPKGWQVLPLSEAVEVNPRRPMAKGTVAPYLEMSNMPTEGPRPLGWYDRPFGSGMRFINGDVLMARITPCLEHGKTAFVDFLEEEQTGWGSTEFIVMRSKPPLTPEYSYFLARSDDVRSYAIAHMTGSSGRQRVPHDCFAHFPIVVPSEEVSTKFGDMASVTLRTIRLNDEQSKTLASIRDALLPKLLSGEIRVGQAESVVEEALA